MSEQKIVWDELNMGDIIKRWIKDYDQSKQAIDGHEFFYDPVKKKVILKLYVRESEDSTN